ncbi:MAG: ornithine carbamoyltransferase [Succinivibrionaceae bacterium]|nr:ornithine carbamoyltransferase [Ruminobacter sp.]MEE1339689.1 ornithine carbamoyltransferase [Succinivibrionaceae bacterium]
MRHMLTSLEFSSDELMGILELAKDMKENPAKYRTNLAGKSVVTLFEKPSLRTRVTFEVGMYRLGGHAVYMDQQNGAIGKRETVKDYARNLSRWCDGIVARVFSHNTLKDLEKYGSVPVINALCDLYHPCQALADFQTIRENYDDLTKVKLAYFGDGNNVTNSLLIAGAKFGTDVTCVCPKGAGPDVQIFEAALEVAKKTGAKLKVTDNVADVKGFDIAYTDTWVSMGDNTPLDSVKAKYMPYQINKQLLDETGIRHVLHCQPAHREYEITSEVMDGPWSLVYDEAENRMHAQMAVLSTLLNQE